MGQDVNSALRQIEATKADLEHDLDELLGRLPEPAVLAHQAKVYGAAAAGTAVTVGIVAMRARSRSRENERRMQARINAEELARAFSPAPPSDDSDGRSRAPLVAALVAAIAVVLTVVNRGRD